MVTDIFDWITIALYNRFGENYKYYVEEVEQNANTPCFMVNALEPLIRARSPVKYYRVFPIVIHYFTDKDNTSEARKDCYSVAENLWDCLEYLDGTADEKPVKIRGNNMSWEIVEGVLQFHITYDFFVNRTVEHIYMEDGTYNGIAMRVDDYI